MIHPPLPSTLVTSPVPKDIFWLLVAKNFAKKSKDPSTKNGAVCVGEDDVMLSQGWNGFPRGFEDTVQRLENREFKLEHVVHSEENCITNAARIGARLKGATLYQYGMPTCNRCACSIVQAGIKRVVVCYDSSSPTRWDGAWSKSRLIFDECGVKYNSFMPQELQPYA